MRRIAVLVNGLPGAGKSTLAAAVSTRLELPVFSKDLIKEAFFDWFGTGDRDFSTRVDAHCEIFCAVPPEVARDRRSRRPPERHAGHPDRVDSSGGRLFTQQPLRIGPLLTVATDRPVDIEHVVAWVRRTTAARRFGHPGAANLQANRAARTDTKH